MKSKYTFKHLDHSDSLVEYADQKLNEVGKFLLKEGQCNVYFSKDQHEFNVEVSINSKQKFFKATGSSTDIYIAVDLMADKLEKQFLKVKEIYSDHKKFELSKAGRLHSEVNERFELQPKFKKSA
jgi:putative sigma-54 modulation protein